MLLTSQAGEFKVFLKMNLLRATNIHLKICLYRKSYTMECVRWTGLPLKNFFLKHLLQLEPR